MSNSIVATNTQAVKVTKKRIIAIGCSTGATQPFVIVAPSIVDTWRQCDDYHSDFIAGQQAFHQRVKFSDAWPEGKKAGWNWAGEGDYLDSCQADGMGIEETFSPWR